MYSFQETDVTRRFPLNVILEVPQYYAIFRQYFPGTLPDREDFDEVLRQVLHALLNHPWDYVLAHIGVTIPEPHLMRDVSLDKEPDRTNQLVLATADIAAALCRFFKSADFFDVNGTLPYTPRNIHSDIMLLDYVSG